MIMSTSTKQEKQADNPRLTAQKPGPSITNRQMKIQALNTHPWFLASSRKPLLECSEHRFAYHQTPPRPSASSVLATKSLPGYLSFCLQ